MYLKSLTLKGFKSFADRAHLVFEPGLTVILGPNGSGKSNISDAVLWVLGEQSAKQLRGQAMEDVIFSGSSARKPAGLAEVTLVLDNADHVLPVDFDEVAITRRMYRSGESEYLINASPCRLMDIQDILHDTGLGKETHSIISQGKLDAILQSKPEERRSLIEEAAGIAKHRRRKERAQRKLASMDAGIERARDVSREVARQLRPLERQVSRARKHQELTARANELTQILAVDELRQLQARWDDVERAAKEAAAAEELARYRVAEKERELERLQVMLEEKGLFVGDLSEQRRHMQDVMGRLSSDQRLLEEKGRNMVRRLSEMRGTLSSSESQRRRASEELESVRGELDRERGAAAQAQADVDELTPAADELHARRVANDEEVARVTRAQREAERRADEAALALARANEALSNAALQDGLYQKRLEQIDEEVARAQASLDDDRAHAAEVESALEEARAKRAEARAAIEDATAALTACRAAETRAREELASIRSERVGLERVDAGMARASSLAMEVQRACPAGVVGHVGDVITAPPELEGLVEQLLGDDIEALLMGDAAALVAGAETALAAGGAGEVLLLSAEGAPSNPCAGAEGVRLLDLLTVDEGAAAAVEALLGGVYVVDSLEEALAAPVCPGVLYVTPSGARVSAGGVVRVKKGSGQAAGALERKRRIRALASREPDATAALDWAVAQVSAASEAQAAARAQESDIMGRVSRAEGERSALLSEIGRLEASLSRSLADRKQVSAQRELAAKAAEAAQPQVEQLTRERDAARAEGEELARRVQELSDESDRLRAEDAEASGRLSDAKVRLARSTERVNSLAARAPELERRIEGIDRRVRGTEQAARSLEVLRLRVDPLHDRYEELLAQAGAWARRLRDQASLEQATSDALKKTIDDAKAEVARATEELEAARAAVNEAKVARGRLEVQVEAAVHAITADGSTSLEEALSLPAPQDRAAAERELNGLARQINNLGPVNQLAVEEYEQLKARADYIEAQLADLEAARKALAKISAAIDRKMRTAFLATYAKVDENFQEIFAMLFPGGRARLEMTDPDHPDETGIEVVAQPRGKKIAKMSLMSGGERSLTALALLFAVYRTRTVPFYVLDEVEAALDDANLGKFIDALDTLRSSTQLLVISHQRRTMEHADVLYGVSMQADGVSRVVSQKLDRSKGKVVNA